MPKPLKISPAYKKKLKNKSWRMDNLYSVKNRQNKVVPYVRNRAQEHFAKNRWYFNIILKARRLGFSTEIGISMLDDTLFNPYDTLLIAHTDDDAKKLFKDKVMNTWMNLPEELQQLWTIDSDRASMLRFDRGKVQDPKTKRWTRNFSSITVALSGRSGGFTKVHISEMGKLCARFPERANEIITGTIPTIPYGGQLDIESTAEGDMGIFHDMFWKAWNDPTNHLPLNEFSELKKCNEYKAHFYNWQWDDEEIDRTVEGTILKTQDMDNSEFFTEYQNKHKLTDKEITYYYYTWKTMNCDFRKLRQEYPTTPEEAFISSGDRFFDPDNLKVLINTLKTRLELKDHGRYSRIRCQTTNMRQELTHQKGLVGTMRLFQS
jgi:hypothetical protein